MCIFNKKIALPPPNPLIEVDMESVLSALKIAFPKAAIFLSDSVYMTTTVEELKRFLEDDKTNEYRFVSEFYDCDDYSDRLMGMIHSVEWGALPFGTIWTETPKGNHAVNCFVDDKYNVWIIEPQNDQVSVVNTSWNVQFVKV